MIELSPDEWVAVRLSLRIALVATVVALPFGLAVAWLLARKHFYGKALLDGLIHLPLVLPPVVTGYLLLISFGRRGPIGAFLADYFGLVFSFRWTGAALACGIMGFPLMVRPIRLALEAIDRIRDTAFAYERVFCVEVMGRDSGFIALAVALGGGAEAVVVPEIPFSLDDICDRVEESHRRGKRSTIVVVSEGPRTGGVLPVAEALTARLHMPARVVVLGHVQRGGAPTARDRLLASRMGAAAVKAILDGAGPTLIGEERGVIVRVPLGEAASKRRPLDPSLIELVH